MAEQMEIANPKLVQEEIIGESHDCHAKRKATSCEEICSDCTHSHRNRKAARLHEPIAVERLKDRSSQSDEMVPLCDPCKDNDINSCSMNYCKVCEEYLCETCTKSHRTRKATKTHDPVPVLLLQQDAEDEETNVNQDRKLCFSCLIIDINKAAKSFCVECEELLCAECTNQHRSKKLTKLHTLESPECVEYVTKLCDICNLKDKKVVMFCNTCGDALCQACAQNHKRQNVSKTHSTESVKGKVLRRIITCDPCSTNDERTKAQTYCKECEENYCEICTRHHRTQKATKKHELISPASINLKETTKPEVKICGECEEEKNTCKYCSTCQHYLCDKCCEMHIRSKFTKDHTVLEPGEIEDRKQHDCESCNTAGAAQFYCEQCKEFFCKNCNKQHQRLKATSNHNLVSVEEGMIQRTANLDKGESTQLRVQDNEKLDVILTKRVEQPKPDYPGKPRASDVLADAITLLWDAPSKFGDDDYYQVSYKDLDHEKKWKFFQGEFKTTTALLSDLKSNTAFIFRVRVVYEDSEGPYSEESDKILTLDSPASRIVKFSVEKEKGNPSPAKYALPTTEIRAARNERAKTKKFEIGAHPMQDGKSKTILLVGATGTGKSTLVDGIVNYVLGVNWDDPFRFTVIDLETEEKDRENNQALSQTEWITCYTLNPEKGSRLNYQLHIIDTPGFGDTRGLNRDQEIVEQIRELFSETEAKGVTFIDAVCFLIKAPDARLTAVQSYIFQSIMSLFGRDIEKNICSLVTFADGIDPPVLAALKQSGLPFGKSFTFNNSGLFARNADISTASLSPMFWDMGLKSFRAFFKHIEQVETKSLKTTKEVLDERARLEATVKNLQPQLDAGLSKVNGLKQEIQIIERNKSLIKDNKNFEYEVDETKQKKKELPRGQHVTNCTNCHFTCHENCAFANDHEKARCIAMDQSTGNCKICPDKCHWQKHANTPYIFEYITVKVKKKYADMQQKYKEATGKLLTQEQIVEKLGEELNDLLDDIEDMMAVIKSCNERLKEIALRPNPLSMTEHIDLMIENEKLEKKDGFLQRINILNDFRKRAQISKDFEQFSKEAHSTLGAAGKKRNRDTKSLLARFGAWFSNKIF
ncbi:uncharacterized protein LOC123556762 [Mercenaria mercenaria]|uniref:uncharacterized protein LOC123556762 n=1 Tax=Mercenaria mercenaria TaxID=6596 RepID=UPI00234F70E8|nr:uncharacterized protein LOC123556762 [Mercenaria mercenaria]